MNFATNYTIRLVALFAVIAVGSYSCAWYNVEYDKKDLAMMKTCMEAGHLWKESRWVRGWHYCE